MSIAETSADLSSHRAGGGTTGVPAVVKCVAILRLLDRHGSGGASLTAIAAELEITKSHCFAILRTLQAAGWICHDPHGRRYLVDSGLLDDLPNLVRDQDRSGRLHRVLVDLSRVTRVPCVLTRINPDDSFVAIDKAEEDAELLVSVPIGHRFPWDAPAQLRTRIAFGDGQAAARLLARWQPQAFTGKSIQDRAAFLVEIETTRTRGYAVSRSEYTLGVMSIAVPVFDRFGKLRMVLQCPGLEADLETREWQVGEAMRRAAEALQSIM